MLVSFLFWNLYGRQQQRRSQRAESLKSSLIHLAKNREIDVFLFSECLVPAQEIVAALNQAGVGNYYAPDSRSQRIRFFSRLPGRPWRDAYNDNVHSRMTAQELYVGKAPGLLIVGIHFHDRTSLPTSALHINSISELAGARGVQRMVR